MSKARKFRLTAVLFCMLAACIVAAAVMGIGFQRNAALAAAEEVFEIIDGASIRSEAPAGMRFRAHVSDAFKDRVESENAGKTIDWGMEFSVEGQSNVMRKDLEVWDTSTTVENQDYYYNVVIYNIPAADYATKVTAKAYYKVDGVYTYAQGAAGDMTVTRSVAYVASCAKQSGESSEFIDAVLGGVTATLTGNDPVAISVGQSKQLTVTCAEGYAVTYVSAYPAVASVSGAGAVKGVSAGSAEITASVGSTSVKLTVTVSELTGDDDLATKFTSDQLVFLKNTAIVQDFDNVSGANSKTSLFIDTDIAGYEAVHGPVAAAGRVFDLKSFDGKGIVSADVKLVAKTDAAAKITDGTGKEIPLNEWISIGTGANYRNLRIAVPSGEVSLYLDNIVTKTYHKVEFSVDGTENGICSRQYIFDGEAAEVPAPTKAGHILIGWDKDVSNVTADIFATAQWAVSEIVNKYSEVAMTVSGNTAADGLHSIGSDGYSEKLTFSAAGLVNLAIGETKAGEGAWAYFKYTGSGAITAKYMNTTGDGWVEKSGMTAGEWYLLKLAPYAFNPSDPYNILQVTGITADTVIYIDEIQNVALNTLTFKDGETTVETQIVWTGDSAAQPTYASGYGAIGWKDEQGNFVGSFDNVAASATYTAFVDDTFTAAGWDSNDDGYPLQKKFSINTAAEYLSEGNDTGHNIKISLGNVAQYGTTPTYPYLNGYMTYIKDGTHKSAKMMIKYLPKTPGDELIIKRTDAVKAGAQYETALVADVWNEVYINDQYIMFYPHGDMDIYVDEVSYNDGALGKGFDAMGNGGVSWSVVNQTIGGRTGDFIKVEIGAEKEGIFDLATDRTGVNPKFDYFVAAASGITAESVVKVGVDAITADTQTQVWTRTTGTAIYDGFAGNGIRVQATATAQTAITVYIDLYTLDFTGTL